jgi:hypothetical protein
VIEFPQKFYANFRAVNFIDLIINFEKLKGVYVFRGQSDEKMELKSTFEKEVEKVGLNPKDYRNLEKTIITEFKRRAHHYLSILPDKSAELEWVALMRHYGCPTRLVDLTRSFLVALFFSVEKAVSDSAIWAISRTFYEGSSPIEGCLNSTYVEDKENKANEILTKQTEKESDATDEEPGVIFVEPHKMNERISNQLGLFLFQKRLDLSFEENLCAPFKKKSFKELEAINGTPAIIKIIIPYDFHEVINYLLLTMNITAATLFPGLDGFARSQRMRIKCAKYGKTNFLKWWIEQLIERRDDLDTLADYIKLSSTQHTTLYQ